MNKEDLLILFFALLLLAAMLYTFLFGGQGSRHGVSVLHQTGPAPITRLEKKSHLDLCQGRISAKRLTLRHDQRVHSI